MKYLKETPKTGRAAGNPYQREEITKEEALGFVSAETLENIARDLRISHVAAVLVQVTPAIYIGVGQ